MGVSAVATVAGEQHPTMGAAVLCYQQLRAGGLSDARGGDGGAVSASVEGRVETHFQGAHGGREPALSVELSFPSSWGGYVGFPEGRTHAVGDGTGGMAF
mmetsp:Transcript_22420/g.45350  ORF Transcript_22420/g.45350 Transcript_22420/m.45350 type:complete len:100 (+) Transcript_22420:1078-1377(+)